MKSKVVLVLMLCFLILLSGCNAEQRDSLRQLINSDIEKDLYTPDSYQNYIQEQNFANAICEKFFASKSELASAQRSLQAAVDALCPKPDKSELSSLIEKAYAIDETKYTTKSYISLKTALSSCCNILLDANVTQQDVDTATTELSDALNSLVIFAKSVYEIQYSFSLLKNNHVGNEWQSRVRYNGNPLKSGDTITASPGADIRLYATVIEQDVIPETGSANASLTLSDGAQSSVKIYVQEYNGRYAGNVAVWLFKCSALLVERI